MANRYMSRAIFFKMIKLVKEITEKYNTVLNFQTCTSAYVVFTKKFFFFLSFLVTCVRGDKNVATWRHWLVQDVCKNNIQVNAVKMLSKERKFITAWNLAIVDGWIEIWSHQIWGKYFIALIHSSCLELPSKLRLPDLFQLSTPDIRILLPTSALF